MADDTATMWRDMLGFGDLLRAVTDPQMLQNAALMMQAISESARTSARIESKLDLLLQEYGHEPQRGTATAFLLEANRPHGIGRCAPASGVADDGSGAAAATNGGAAHDEFTR